MLAGLVQLALSVFIAFFFFRDGEAIIERARGALERLAGERGQRLAAVATLTVRGVVVGILGTALAQGVLMAIGLLLVGIKAAPLLGLVTFFLSPVPVGPPLVWIPAGLWLLQQGSIGSGTFILLWGLLVVSTVDNILKPLIISRGSDLPFVLVLLGVLGGAVAFGFIGVFLGPVLLAVGAALVREWADSAPPAEAGGDSRDARANRRRVRRCGRGGRASQGAGSTGFGARSRSISARNGDSAVTICANTFGVAAITWPPCRKSLSPARSPMRPPAS